MLHFVTHKQDKFHDQTMRRIGSSITRLPSGEEKVRFLKLHSALEAIYARYSAASVEARVRPSIKTKAVASAIFEEYITLLTDIEMSLTLAKLFIG
jgi:hypothetical protein